MTELGCKAPIGTRVGPRATQRRRLIVARQEENAGRGRGDAVNIEQLTNTARCQIADALHPAEPCFSITKDPHQHGEVYRMDIEIMGIGVQLYADHADDPDDLQWRFEWKGDCYDLWRLSSCLLGQMWERMDEAMQHAQEMNDALAWRDVRRMR